MLLFSFNRIGNFQNFSFKSFPMGTPPLIFIPIGEEVQNMMASKWKYWNQPNVNWWEMLLANYKISLLFLLIVIDGMWYHNKCWALEIFNPRDLIQINQIMELSTLHKS